MDKATLTRHFRHLLRKSMNENEVQLGVPFDEVAAFMFERCQELANPTLVADDHAYDAAVLEARNEVSRLTSVNVHEEPLFMGCVQGALAIGGRIVQPV